MVGVIVVRAKPRSTVFLSKLLPVFDSVAALGKNIRVRCCRILLEISNKFSTRAAASYGIANVRARMGVGVLLIRVVTIFRATEIGTKARFIWIEGSVALSEPFPTVCFYKKFITFDFFAARLKNISVTAGSLDILNKGATSMAKWIIHIMFIRRIIAL